MITSKKFTGKEKDKTQCLFTTVIASERWRGLILLKSIKSKIPQTQTTTLETIPTTQEMRSPRQQKPK
jgi:hypothetical protein